MLMATLRSQMGFTPSAGASLGVCRLARKELASEQERFDVIVPSGERIGYGARLALDKLHSKVHCGPMS
jgi:hypothetical protein